MKIYKIKNGKGRAAAFGIAGVLIAAVLITVGVVLAKYLHKEENNGTVKALEFYFTSNLLDGKTHTLAPGSTEVTFTLGNHEDDLRYAEVDVNYTVAVTGGTATAYPASGTISAGSVKDQTITVTGLTAGTYTITAVGENGYTKTLTGTVVIPEAEEKVYKYLDTSNSEYVLLTVWSDGYKGDVTITPPDGVLPDNTDEVMHDVLTGNAFTDSVTFNKSSYSSHSYRFFGSGVSVNDFTVTYNGIAAEVKQPN